MGIRFSIRFLLVITALFGLAALAVKLWNDRWTQEEIVEELNHADAAPLVWDHDIGMVTEEEFSVAHLSGVINCVGVRFNQLDSPTALLVASKVESATELVLIDMNPSLPVADFDFGHVINLHLGGGALRRLDDWLEVTGELTELSLAASDNHLQESVYSRLAKLRSLRILRLSGTHLTRSNVSELRRLSQLSHISFYACDIDDSVFKELSALAALESLELNGATIDDDTVRQLESLRNIKKLSLSDSAVTDRGVAMLARYKHLESLSLYGCQNLTRDCVPDLLRMRFLEWLDVLRTPIEEDDQLRSDPPAMLAEWIY